MRTTTEVKHPMMAPSHPGEVLRAMYLEPMDVTITKAAGALGVSRKHVSAIVNGSVPVTPDMAARLAAVFGPDVQFWINLQAQYDVWDVGRRPPPKVKSLEAA
jgi:antitoxin HigA-1